MRVLNVPKCYSCDRYMTYMGDQDIDRSGVPVETWQCPYDGETLLRYNKK